MQHDPATPRETLLDRMGCWVLVLIGDGATLVVWGIAGAPAWVFVIGVAVLGISAAWIAYLLRSG